MICASTGNHGRAVSYAAARLGIPATVCMSRLVPENKVAAIERLGARVVIAGDSQDEAQAQADTLAERHRLTDTRPSIIPTSSPVTAPSLWSCWSNSRSWTRYWYPFRAAA